MNKNAIFLIAGCILLVCVACRDKSVVEQSRVEPPPATDSVSLKQEPVADSSAVISSEGALTLPVKIEISPDLPQKGDRITLKLTGVPDGASVGYVWKHEGTLLQEAGNTLKLGENFKRGDRIECRVTVTASGKSDAWAVIVKVANAVPVIEQPVSMVKVHDRVYRFLFKATDPDGDTLSYSLKDPVEGAVIDKQTGEIQYSVPAGSSGKQSFIVRISDGNGSDLFYTIEFEPK